MTTIPATKITVPTWTSLSISRSVSVAPDGSFTPILTNSASVGSASYLGDANGIPQQPIAAPMLISATVPLTEEVTREDGTKLTVAALLDSIVLAVAATKE